jgi:hypothetical protein
MAAQLPKQPPLQWEDFERVTSQLYENQKSCLANLRGFRTLKSALIAKKSTLVGAAHVLTQDMQGDTIFDAEKGLQYSVSAPLISLSSDSRFESKCHRPVT